MFLLFGWVLEFLLEFFGLSVDLLLLCLVIEREVDVFDDPKGDEEFVEHFYSDLLVESTDVDGAVETVVFLEFS